MEFTEVVKNRYSCKKYSGKQISTEQLNAILEAGRLAPTAKNLQEQKIYAIQNPELLAQIDAVTPSRYGAPTMLVVAYEKNNVFTYPDKVHSSGIEDATIVATHMILAAANAGVDSCWINNFHNEKIAGLLSIPEEYDIVMLMDLGFAAEGAGPLPNHDRRKALSETVVFL